MATKILKATMLGAVVALMLTTVGCGYSEEEMQAKQREIDRINAELKTAKTQIADDQKKYSDSSAEREKLRGELKKVGIDLEQTKSAAEKLEQAMREYKQRADQLTAIEQRFRDLKARLDKLNSVGLKVVVRNNRMVIQLPGDVLFDSGKDELKQSGKDVLLQVAEVVRNDTTLSTRNFQVAGHTDGAKYPPGGPFKDNWGLSLARARQVLLFLTSPVGDKANKDPKKQGGGGLDTKHWSASGFGDTDPQAGTVDKQSNDEMGKNRRVELVLEPNVEEMLNLSNIH
jgi:chemotaxis protein MotB